MLLSAVGARAMGPFTTVDPMQWYDTEYFVEAGVLEVRLDILFKSPCKFDIHESMYDIERIAYERLKTLCDADFLEVLEAIASLDGCLPTAIVLRAKRALPLVVYGGYAIAVAAGAYSGYTVYTDNKRISELELRLAVMNSTVDKIERMEREATNDRKALVEIDSQLAERTKNDKQAATQQAELSANIGWTSSKLSTRLNGYKTGIKMLRAHCRQRKLSLHGLDNIVQIHQLSRYYDDDIMLDSLTVTSRDTITLKFYIGRPDTRLKIYQVLAIDHWANYTTKQVFVTYSGPRFVLHNTENDCVKGIEQPKQKTVFDNCGVAKFHDAALTNWTRVPGTLKEINERAKPSVVRLGNLNIIYCLYHRITIVDKEMFCPGMPFSLARNVPFNLTNMNYSVESSSFSTVNRNTLITTPVLVNKTDNEYDTMSQGLITLKERNEKEHEVEESKAESISTLVQAGGGIFGASTLLFALIKAYSLWTSRGTAASADQHQDTHNESVKIYNNVNAGGPTNSNSPSDPNQDQQVINHAAELLALKLVQKHFQPGSPLSQQTTPSSSQHANRQLPERPPQIPPKQTTSKP